MNEMSALVAGCFISNLTSVCGCGGPQKSGRSPAANMGRVGPDPGSSPALTCSVLSGTCWHACKAVALPAPICCLLEGWRCPSGLAASFVPFEWAVVDNKISEYPLTPDHPGRHLWSSSLGLPGPCQAPVANH